jgi:hypothetical protein
LQGLQGFAGGFNRFVECIGGQASEAIKNSAYGVIGASATFVFILIV